MTSGTTSLTIPKLVADDCAAAAAGDGDGGGAIEGGGWQARMLL